MTTRVERGEDRLADFTRDKRILILSLMAIVIGVLSAVVAKLLVWLIALITNLVFQKLSADFVSTTNNHLGAWMILAPVAGGLIIGLMARSQYLRALRSSKDRVARLRSSPHFTDSLAPLLGY